MSQVILYGRFSADPLWPDLGDPQGQVESPSHKEQTNSEHAPQQVAPRSEQLAPEIPRHRCQRALGVANCPVKRTLQPPIHLLWGRCQSSRQTRHDDGTDDGGELLPRFSM
jgi:hypothetical protein